jgi:hypothetical protein
MLAFRIPVVILRAEKKPAMDGVYPQPNGSECATPFIRLTVTTRTVLRIAKITPILFAVDV